MSHEVPPDVMQGLLCVSGDLRSLGKPIKGHLVCPQAWLGYCCSRAWRARARCGIALHTPGCRSCTLQQEVEGWMVFPRDQL